MNNSTMNNENIPPSPENQAATTSNHNANTPPTTKQVVWSDEKLLRMNELDRQRSKYMQRQFEIAREHPELLANRPLSLPPHERERLYFFYGSLMDSKLLSSILGLEAEPELRPAHVVGFRIMLNGQFPAMVFSQGQIVSGVTYQIGSHEEVASQAAKLQSYETGRYRRRAVIVEYEDGTSASAWTFVWRGEKNELREGVFDLKAWQEMTYGPKDTAGSDASNAGSDSLETQGERQIESLM